MNLQRSLFKRAETIREGGPQSLLEGMSDYFVLQAHNKRTANDYSPNKKCDWTLVTKAIFNPQAPQHKIFKDNLSKVIEDNSRYNSTKLSRQSMSRGDQGERESIFNKRKGNKRPQTTDQRLLQYFSRVEQKIQELNELKSNLNSYKDGGSHYQLMNNIKILNKQSNSIKTERPLFKQLDIDVNEKENQLPLKQVPVLDKFYANTTKASEAKKIEKLEQREFKIKINKQVLLKRRHTLNINQKQQNWTSRLVSKCENSDKLNFLAMSQDQQMPSKVENNGGVTLFKEVNRLRCSEEFSLKPYSQELKLFRRPTTTAFTTKTGQNSANSNSLANIKI